MIAACRWSMVNCVVLQIENVFRVFMAEKGDTRIRKILLLLRVGRTWVT
jgi:hypothetical protein